MVFKEGDKVEIPLTKSVGLKWERSENIMKALGSNQPFLYVEWTYEDNVYLSWNSNERLPGGKRSSGGERFLISEVNLFTEASPTTEVILLLRKTIKEINGEENSIPINSIPIKTITRWA